MDDSKILITGGKGQLGLALQERFPKAIATDVTELDITSTDSVANFNWDSITTILNAAAFTNVDGAETDEGRVAAWRVNAQAVANLANIAIEKKLTLVHISTDYVFDGSKNPHLEDEPLSPLSAYGASKAAGEVVISLVPKHYLLRTSWVIGQGKNFVRTMLELGQKGVNPSVVSDQIGRPTFTNTLVDAIGHLLESQSEFGTYNVSNDGEPVSWADLTREIFKISGVTNTVTDTSTEAYYKDKPQAAPRPLNSIFDLSKITSTGFTANDWRNDLKQYIDKEMKS
jgi:dTDP-4-dehydrorhamnose reductase